MHFLIQDCKIDPNILDENDSSPLFYVNDFEMIQELAQYDINWFQINKSNKDCINIFTNLNYNESVKKLIDFSQNKMKESIEKNNLNSLDDNFVYERIKANLLEMVNTDKTKKELSDFIKKYKIDNISEIKDEEGNSLAQLCLMKNNWARYEMFKKYYGLNYKNKKGVSNLEIMLSKNNVNRESQAINIVKEIIKTKSFINNNLLGVNLFNVAIERDKYLSLPFWLFSKKSSNEELLFFKELTQNNEEMLRDFQVELENGKKNNDFSYFNSSEGSSLFTTYLILCFDNLYNNSNLFKNLSLNDLFEEEFSFLSKQNIIRINQEAFFNIKNAIYLCNKYDYFKTFAVDYFEQKLEAKIVEQLIIGYKKISEGEFNENTFYGYINKNKPAFDFLTKLNSKLSFELIDKNFIEKIKKIEYKFNKQQDIEIITGINYLYLNNNLKNKAESPSKSVKI